jgi:hypothetical protein
MSWAPNLRAFLSQSVGPAIVTHAPHRLARMLRKKFVGGRNILPVTITAALLSVVAAPVIAQNSISKLKAPTSGTVTVKVTNWREADLVGLEVVESGSANWKKVLGALKAGQWTWAKVPHGKNCRVNLRGKYADGKSADVPDVDICADKTVDLVN